MIVVKIKGGLGNQMFQYAMARKVQMELKTGRIGFDPEVVNRDKQRNFSLQHFALFDQAEMVEKRNKATVFQEWLARKLVSYFVAGRQEGVAAKREDFMGTIFGLFGIIQRDHSLIRKCFFLRFHKNIYMNGWFQDAGQLLPIRNVLLEDFKWVSAEAENSDIYRQIKSTNAVCVHIRRGDYNNNPIYGVCRESYYCQALDYMRKKLTNPVFYIFSDDIAGVERTMKFPCSVVYVEDEREDFEDLYLMKSCRHFVMSNSTYSWWAQFLSEADDKVVVAPEKWCFVEDMRVGVYMDNWVLLDAGTR